jgi:fermentation-respiration switch protein FrsA (DUF1100 family)
MVAVDDGGVGFLVLLAGPGLTGAEVLSTQNREIMEVENTPASVIEWRLGWLDQVIEIAASDLSRAEAAAAMDEVVEEAATDVPLPGIEEELGEVTEVFLDPPMRAFLRHDPAVWLTQVEVPVLAVIGELDTQVSATDNIPALEEALAGNPDATVMELVELNHLFQHAETGAISEYFEIEETFAPEVLDLIGDWILERF